jgi:hypothetical protein
MATSNETLNFFPSRCKIEVVPQGHRKWLGMLKDYFGEIVVRIKGDNREKITAELREEKKRFLKRNAELKKKAKVPVGEAWGGDFFTGGSGGAAFA